MCRLARLLASESFQARTYWRCLMRRAQASLFTSFPAPAAAEFCRKQHFRRAGLPALLAHYFELASGEPAGTTFDLILFDGPLKLSFILSPERAHFVPLGAAPARRATHHNNWHRAVLFERKGSQQTNGCLTSHARAIGHRQERAHWPASQSKVVRFQVKRTREGQRV